MGACGSSAKDSAAGPVITKSGDGGGGGPVCKHFVGAHDDIINGVAGGESRAEFLTCAEDRTVALTSCNEGAVIERWRGHEKGISRVLSAPRLGGAVTASRDTTVRIWRRGSAEAAAVLQGHELLLHHPSFRAQSAPNRRGRRWWIGSLGRR